MIPAPLDREGGRRLLDAPGVRVCLDALHAENEETRLVGGCVRDALLARPLADVDLATTLPPVETMARARRAGLKAVPTGFDHGTVTLVVAGRPFEVTTLREDVETDGRHARVRFGRDFARDAERRDFTINALSLDRTGQIADTVGGLADLAAGRVCFIGDPATRIREDALRILRFFRFHARYGNGAPDRAGLAACIAGRAGLDRLSRERVRAETLKLLVAPGMREAVAVLSGSGLLARMTGGVGDLGRLARVEAFERAASVEPDPVRRLAALAVATCADAERLARLLRLSRAEAVRLEAYAGLAARLHGAERVERGFARALVAEHGQEALVDACAALDGEPRPVLAPEARTFLNALLDGAETAPSFPLTGADLVAAGAGPGPRLGRALLAARRAWYAQGCPTGTEAAAGLLAVAFAAYRAEGADAALPARHRARGPQD